MTLPKSVISETSRNNYALLRKLQATKKEKHKLVLDDLF